ncbi:MAG: glycosyltransferase family 4 protein, partial [Planctomycetota bacterium]|nr:glycosyltransferase family 4 protein [Planctomycetota bacterium]
IIDRFWPLVDGASRTLGDLAIELHKRGMPGTFLTARWQDNWSRGVTFHGMNVHRLANPPPPLETFKSTWATTYYSRAIANWLRRNRRFYDIVVVSGLRHEANAAVLTLVDGSGVPIVLRAEQPGRRGDCLWQLDAPGGRQAKKRVMRAQAFVAPSRQVHRELIAAGYDRGRIHYLPHATRVVDCRLGKEERRKKARGVLAAASPGLRMPSWAQLAVFTGRLVEENRLESLIAAWPKIAARWPNARLWIVGDGSEKSMLQVQIQNLNLAERVRLVGTFDHVGELLDAADVFVHPAPGEDLPVATLEAMAAGLPVVAANNSSNRELITHAGNGLLFDAKTSHTEDDTAYPTLAEAIYHILDDADLAQRFGADARRTVAEHFDLAKCTDSYIKLFESLLGEEGERIDVSGGACPRV